MNKAADEDHLAPPRLATLRRKGDFSHHSRQLTVMLQRIPSQHELPNGPGLRIKARPLDDGGGCHLRANRQLVVGGSVRWSDQNLEAFGGLGRKLWACGEFEAITLFGQFLLATFLPDRSVDWTQSARALATVLRAHLDAGLPVVDSSFADQVPDECAIAAALQTIIEQEVGPALAQHDGHLAITQIVGNTVFLEMGGTCKGCNSAVDTLRYGIDEAFRRAVPELGGIFTSEHYYELTAL